MDAQLKQQISEWKAKLLAIVKSMPQCETDEQKEEALVGIVELMSYMPEVRACLDYIHEIKEIFFEHVKRDDWRAYNKKQREQGQVL